ncbi:hypothetical protein DPEC_G00052020 [Dallia pectoralis]|uniref:Uncharacterized protein n=1 Tax=Dallia pectoralis TaxID=75939 RepID=A0ACC2HBA1_DALPE|nr:hypothetical protein DPEC_G00052020 [Dallia pectoralis]
MEILEYSPPGVHGDRPSETSAGEEARDGQERGQTKQPANKAIPHGNKGKKRKSGTEEKTGPAKKTALISQEACFLAVEKKEEEEEKKPKKRRKKKTITDVLATSEPKPGCPGDLQSLVQEHFKNQRSVIELEELNLQDSSFLACNDLTHSLSSYLKEICPKWAKVQSKHTEKSSAVMLIVCSSALRVIEVIKQMTTFKGEAKVLKLFAKHIKVEEQIKLLQKTVTHIGVGTPGRLTALIGREGLSLSALRFLVLDWNWRDQKLRRMVDLPEVKGDLMKLLDDRAAVMGKTEANTGPLARRPDNSAFKQQRLPAWSPMLTAQTVLPFFYCLSVVCVLLGVWLLVTVQNTYQYKVDYTEAGSCNTCFEMRKSYINAKQKCNCTVEVNMKNAIKGNVFFYYGLRNFHQNLRQYMDSRDDAQMMGKNNNLLKPSNYCYPFVTGQNGLSIAPCGAVANSLFNDSFTLYYSAEAFPRIQVPLFRKGIAWYTDKNVKFRNPQIANNTETLAQAFQGTVQPPFWQKPVFDLDPRDPNNNGFINEDLIVWMREAAFPNFKKLYGVLDRSRKPFTEGLPPGNYSIQISYNFPVEYFRGRKEVVLSTVSWFGGPNNFLPIAYLVTGCLIMLVAIVLTVIWWKFGKNGQNMAE